MLDRAGCLVFQCFAIVQFSRRAMPDVADTVGVKGFAIVQFSRRAMRSSTSPRAMTGFAIVQFSRRAMRGFAGRPGEIALP